MKSYPLQNIANWKNQIYLFCREKDGSQKIIVDKSFLPYYYEPTTDKESDALSIYGQALKKIYCQQPGDVRKQRSNASYSSDLIYTYRYLVDKVDIIEKSNTRIVFFDIEVQAPELPRPKETQTAPYPISTIVIYDNYIKKYKTFFIKDYKSEFNMLEDFCNYIYKLKPDILTGWNAVDFDFLYLQYRFPDFAKKISPINQIHWRNGYEMPAGISIVDMTGLDVKFTLSKRDSYKLNEVAHEDLNYKLWEDEDFMNIEMSKEKCQQDVEKLVKLNEKNHYFELFDSIRRFSKTNWEDMPAEYKNYSWQSLNSRPWDILFFQIAKKLNRILPNKPNYTDEERHELKYNVNYKKDGAYRDTFQKGVFFDCIKCDLGCYSADTEILTEDGWKTYKELTIGENVASFNIRNNLIEFQNLLYTHTYKVKNEEMIHIKNRSLDQLLTWNHKMLFKRTIKSYKGIERNPEEWQICLAKDFTKHHSILPVSGQIKDKKDYNIDDDLIRIYAWIISDGTAYQKKKNHSISYSIYQSNNKNYKYCLEIDKSFKNLNWDIKSHIRKRIINNDLIHNLKTEEKHWYIPTKYSNLIKLEKNHKIIPLWMLQNLSKRQLLILLDTLMKGDGDKTRKHYNAHTKLARDRFQYLCVLLGYRTIQHKKGVYFQPTNYTNVMSGIKYNKPINKLKYSGIVWCPTVQNGFVVMRRNGKVFISGNSAYPRMIIDFNLDVTNLRLQKDMPEWFPSEDEITVAIEQGYSSWANTKWGTYLKEKNIIPVPIYFRESKEELQKRKEYKNNFPTDWKSLRWICYYIQNPETIAPKSFEYPMQWKQELKNKLKQVSIDTEEGKVIDLAYKACKSFNNSGFGSYGNIYTRLFNLYTFNTTTALPRDLLNFLQKKLKKHDIEIIFIDTDSFVLNTSDKSIINRLNKWIVAWAMNKYNNPNVNVELEYEGIFRQLYVGSKCRYIGKLEKPNEKIEIEKKGLQLVRRDYEKFVKDFQAELIKEKLWQKKSKEEIIEWIKEKIEAFKKAPLQEIAIPCKINKPREEYAKKEIYFEALDETQKLISEFNKEIGERYWWIYMQEPRVLAFDKDNQKHIDRKKIDWNAMIERCIFNILVPTFESLSWEEDLLNLAESYSIILGSQYRNKLLENCDNFEELKKYYSAREAKKRIKEKYKSIESDKKFDKKKASKSLKTKKIKKKEGSIDSIKSVEKLDKA